MNRKKILFFATLVVILGAALAVIITKSFTKNSASPNAAVQSVSSPTPGIGGQSALGNAFIDANKSDVSLPVEPDKSRPSLITDTSGASGPSGGTGAQTNPRTATISGPSGPATVTITPLSLPSVPDSEITISSSGVSTALDYLTYFNVNAQKMVFDGKKFDTVLKDKNGITLFVPGLIEKAIADNDFGEVANSLKVQQEFIQAEISFLEAMPVTGTAIAIDKENIGLEELMSGVADKALAVAAGTLSKNDFANYYDQYNATAETARRNFIAQSGILSLNKTPSFLDRVFGALGINKAAKAQGLYSPLGGVVLFIQLCPCDLGLNVIIGPPTPATVFVPDVFLATPLFFDFKALRFGVFWLGLYDPLAQIPCAQPPVCEPTDFAGEIIMTGTSD